MIKVQKFKPMEDRVLVRELPFEQEEGSIIVLENSLSLVKATIIAVGNGTIAKNTGELIPLTVSKGDTVLMLKNDYPEIEVNGELLKLIHEGDIQGII